MYAGQHYWRATLGAALIGGALCGAAAWYGLYPASAVGAAGLLVWVAWRVLRTVPSFDRARRAPIAWSPYDRRRSGRVTLRQRLLRWLRPRRAAATGAAPEASRLRPIARRPGTPRRPRERDAH